MYGGGFGQKQVNKWCATSGEMGMRRWFKQFLKEPSRYVVVVMLVVQPVGMVISMVIIE